MQYKYLFLSAIIFFSLFFPSITLAAAIPYLITDPIPPIPTVPGASFFQKEFDLNYQSGNVFLSSNPDGSGNTLVDDAVEIVADWPDSPIIGRITHRYAQGCYFLLPHPPEDIWWIFAKGVNKVKVKLYDICGFEVFSSRLYLVNNGAPDPSPTPTPTPSPTPTPIPKTPLIFIPGIGGSELKVAEDRIWNEDDGHGGKYSQAYPKDEKVWVNEGEAASLGEDDYFDILRLKPDGQTSEANLELTGNLFEGTYQPTLDFFIDNGYTLNQDLFTFPYDWRKDISLTSSSLDQKVEDIKTQTGAEKVDIVTHSMGGLVARNYISNPDKANKVSKLITLGTPHLGSTEFLKALNYGICITKQNIPQQPICLGLTPSELRDILNKMGGGFELAPTQKYFNFYPGNDNLHPVPFKDERDIDQNNITGDLNYTQTKELLTNLGHNTSLFNPSESFHNLDNNLSNTNGVDTTIIAGSGIPTLGQIIEKYSIGLLGTKIPKKDEIMINGDDTVPLFSASIDDPERNLSLKGPAKLYYSKQSHSGLVGNGPALNLALNILNNDSNLPDETANAPFELNGFQLSVHSPVNIHIYDSNNNHIGPLPNGDFEANIPGSAYDTLDDAKFIFLPNDGIYTIKFESTGEGTFDFKIREYANDLIEKTTLYKDIPVPTTQAQTIFDTLSDTPPVIEVNSSQVTPFSTLTGNSNYDLNPPEVKVIFSLDSKKIEIIGVDDTTSAKTDLIPVNKALITDNAGNSTLINYELKNAGTKISLTDYLNNSLQVVSAFHPKTGKMQSLTQSLFLNDKIITSTYNSSKNKSTIITTEKGKKTKTETKNGVILLYLQTNNGILEAGY